VNTGFTCIANILEGVNTPLTSHGVQEILDVASEQLRLLAHVVELARDDPTALPVVDSVAQDSFIDALASKIQAFETVVSQHTPKSDVPPDQATQGAILMARLLQFNMAFRGVWTLKARSLSEDLCKSVFNLALVSSKTVSRRRSFLMSIRPTAQATISILLLSRSFSIRLCTSSMVGLFIKVICPAPSLTDLPWQNLLLTARPARRISSAITRKFTWLIYQLICLPNTDSSFAVFFHTHHPTKASQI
jgi:hypothetical protein